MYPVLNARRLDLAVGPHEDVLPDFERMVRDSASVQFVRWPQHAPARNEAVPTYSHGDNVLLLPVLLLQRLGGPGIGVCGERSGEIAGGRGCGRRGGGGGGGSKGAHEVPPDADLGLYHGAAAEDDVLGSVQVRAPRDFVAAVGFDVFAFGLGAFRVGLWCHLFRMDWIGAGEEGSGRKGGWGKGQGGEVAGDGRDGGSIDEDGTQRSQ